MSGERAERRYRDPLVTIGILLCAFGVCSLLARVFDDTYPFATSVFLLAVVLIARFTAGYGWGVLGAAVSVVCINVVFTYPYWEFNMTIPGYPLTFSVTLLVSVIVSALTTRIKRQEQLRYEAEREKMRANLLRSVAHDLRTPLAAILGDSSTLLDGVERTKEERDMLAREIHRDARWLIRVMENILSVTKLSGDMTLKKEAEVVEEIVGSAIVKYRRAPEALPVNVRKPDSILLVPMEATLIEQVLINLFENVGAHGISATRIDVTVQAGAGRVMIRVEDDGAGIPPEILPRVFEGNLRSAASPRSDGRRNMGIGLSVCRSILLAHGGGIEAYNCPGGGAGFRFWLPCEEDKDELERARQDTDR